MFKVNITGTRTFIFLIMRILWSRVLYNFLSGHHPETWGNKRLWGNRGNTTHSSTNSKKNDTTKIKLLINRVKKIIQTINSNR